MLSIEARESRCCSESFEQIQAESRLQDSLLWGEAGKTQPRWLKALWLKVLGPFEWHKFRIKRHFWLFWLGEKCQAVGFFWEMCRGLSMAHVEKNTKPTMQAVSSREGRKV